MNIISNRVLHLKRFEKNRHLFDGSYEKNDRRDSNEKAIIIYIDSNIKKRRYMI